MGVIAYTWALSAGDNAEGNDDLPPSGSEEIGVKTGSTDEYAALADALDATRERMNTIITHWKEAVGPEPDSTMGRSNQASSTVAEDDGDDDDDDGEEE